MTGAAPGEPRGGLVIETGLGTRFVPAATAQAVAPFTAPAPVPGFALPAMGVAAIDDRVASVLLVGETSGGVILCETQAGWGALAGARIVGGGTFPPRADGSPGVSFEGGDVEELDLDALLIEAERAMWRARTRDEGIR